MKIKIDLRNCGIPSFSTLFIYAFIYDTLQHATTKVVKKNEKDIKPSIQYKQKILFPVIKYK